MKKIISLVVALVAILSCFSLAACAEKDTGKNKAPVDLDAEYEHPLTKAGLNFDGEEIRIVVASNVVSRDAIAAIGVDVDEKTGETLVDSVYDRNAQVEALLGVDIQLIDVFPHSGFTKSVQDVLMAGDDEYDIFFAQQGGDIDLCLDGYIINLHDLSEYGNPTCHIQEDAEWWGGKYMDLYTVEDELYWLSGNLSMNYTGGAICSLVNLTMYNKLFLEEYGSIYDVVRRGDWTFDLMAKMSSVVYQDADSSDSITAGDTFGWWFGGSSFYKMAMVISSGIETTQKNADGTLTFLINQSNSHFIERSQAIYTLLYESVGITETKDVGKFTDGNTLFDVSMLNYLRNAEYREMSDDFAVIPTPKFNQAQEEYRIAMHDNNHLIGLPYTNTKIEACTATLELMAYLSYYNVFPEYLNEALKYKYTRDEEAAEMIQLIYDGVYTDFGIIWEQYIFGSLWLRNNGISKNPASNIKKGENNWLRTFNETIAALESVSVGEKSE